MQQDSNRNFFRLISDYSYKISRKINLILQFLYNFNKAIFLVHQELQNSSPFQPIQPKAQLIKFHKV